MHTIDSIATATTTTTAAAAGATADSVGDNRESRKKHFSLHNPKVASM